MSKIQRKGKSFQGSVVPDYIADLPDAIPPGRILVHNSVRPAKRLGYRGFRAWLSFPEPKCVICDCKWASNLGKHYRVGTDDPLAGRVSKREGEQPRKHEAPAKSLQHRARQADWAKAQGGQTDRKKQRKPPPEQTRTKEIAET